MFTNEIGNTPLSPIPDCYLPEEADAKWFIIPKGKDKGKKLFL